MARLRASRRTRGAPAPLPRTVGILGRELRLFEQSRPVDEETRQRVVARVPLTLEAHMTDGYPRSDAGDVQGVHHGVDGRDSFQDVVRAVGDPVAEDFAEHVGALRREL